MVVNTAERKRVARLRVFRERERPDFEPRLSAIIKGDAITYLSPEKSVRLWDICTRTDVTRRGSGRKSQGAMQEYLEKERRATTDTPCYVFLWHHENLGGIVIPLHTFLQHGLELVELDGDTVFALLPERQLGYTLDLDLSGTLPDHGYELFRWPVAETGDDGGSRG